MPAVKGTKIGEKMPKKPMKPVIKPVVGKKPKAGESMVMSNGYNTVAVKKKK